MEIVIYIFIVFLGLASAILGFAIEIAQGNITHIINGREPNAGAAIFPTIIALPAFYSLSFWLGNKITEDAGFYFVSIFFILTFSYGVVQLYTNRRKLHDIQKPHS